MAAGKRHEGLQYDDELDPATAPATAKLPWPKTPDELDCRWVPGARGYLSVRDPFTGERHDLATKYAEPQPLRPAPQWMVRRAMDKLPPRRPGRPAPPPRPSRRPREDDGPL